jgi:ABC-type multidrug transport system ATPase subunit
MLDVKNLSKRYKKQSVLTELNHSFGQGITIMTGPSGVGKTTLLRLCATAEKPTSGTIRWQGKPIKGQMKAYRSILGYAPQQINFPDDISALDFMVHIGAMKGLSRRQSEAQSESLLTRLGLVNDSHKKLQAFSGGMKRRLGLAQAFLGDPQCLIVDEPTAELDPLSAKTVHDLIFEKGQNAAVIMTTHLAESLSGYDYETLKLGAKS